MTCCMSFSMGLEDRASLCKRTYRGSSVMMYPGKAGYRAHVHGSPRPSRCSLPASNRNAAEFLVGVVADLGLMPSTDVRVIG